MQVQPFLITPAENFDLFYFLRNPTDNTTYYIQAVIYDVRTGAILLTTQLAQSATNPHLFLKTVQAPPDSQSIGRNIVAIASVYTDSGYTTKSDAYEEQETYFLIKAQTPHVAGAMGIDYTGIREMMKEVVDDALNHLPKPKEAPDAPPLPEMPFDSVFGALGALQREINRIPKESADLTPLQAALTSITTAIGNLPPPTPQTDLAPLTHSIATFKTAVIDAVAEMKQGTIEIPTDIENMLDARLTAMEKKLREALTATIESQEFSFPVQRQVKRPEPKPVGIKDLSHITG